MYFQRSLFTLVACFIVSATPALTEPVLVKSGFSEGQGWAFKKNSSCWVATAGHVIDPKAGAIAIGPSGAQGEAVTFKHDDTLDLSFFEVRGRLAQECPSSSLGDRDTRPLLKRLIQRNQTISIERRVGSTNGGAFGLDILPIEVIALSEAEAAFTIRVQKSEEDAIIQSDSGSPVRMRGEGLLEAGLPLGLVLADVGGVESGYVSVLRMDAVRASAERLLTTAKKASLSKESASFEIISFEGNTTDTRCGPMNLIRPGQSCGWRSKREGSSSSLSIQFPVPLKVTGISLKFNEASTVRGAAISSNRSQTKKLDWAGERYCTLTPGGELLECSLGLRETNAL